MKKKMFVMLAMLMAAALTLAACSAAGNVENPAAAGWQSVTHQPEPGLTLEEAQSLVLEELEISQAEFTKKEFDREDGKFELELMVGDTEYDVDVDASTGNILKVEKETQKPRPTAAPSAPPATQTSQLSLEDAKKLVFAHLGITESQISYPDFQLDEGKFELDFHVGDTEYEVDVDAATGKILKIEKEVEKPRPTTPPATTVPSAPSATQTMTWEDAKLLVLSFLGIAENQTYDWDFDYENGRFELEFQIGNMEYEVDVEATTGKILKVEKEIDD